MLDVLCIDLCQFRQVKGVQEIIASSFKICNLDTIPINHYLLQYDKHNISFRDFRDKGF